MGKIYCKECGTELENTVNFCSKCGTPVNNENVTVNSNKSADKFSKNDSLKKNGKSRISIYRKVIVVTVVGIFVIAGFIMAVMDSPLYSAGLTIDSSDYFITSDKISRPIFDMECEGSNVNFKENNVIGEIDLWHHNAHGYNVDDYLKHYIKSDNNTDIYNGVKVEHVDNITVDGVRGYIMNGTWVGNKYTWVILVNNDEYYLICFHNANNDQQKFLNSLKFKDN